MKKVFIKYNPYKLETEVRVDGMGLAQNSKIGERIADSERLQEWIEDLPKILVEEYNDSEFEVEFHGTLLDYEDLTYVLNEAREKNIITVGGINHKPAKETSDKEALIDEVFAKIQKGPFDELRVDSIVSAFKSAKSEDFEVCVVATMSAGKSTLINAMLGEKLMPSKQEACTAIITRIKDVTTGKEDENIPFKAEVYNKDEQLSTTYEKLTYEIMDKLNSDENISTIKVAGNIPFVSSEDVSLVLIDTPGPNNSRDPRHRKVQSELLGKSSKALVLYIMTGEFGTDDDNSLLKRVAESMEVGGKQSKDRFIFVVNKLDDRKKEDGDTNQTLDRVRAYLKTHGIENPNLFPASALTAVNLRLISNGADVDEDTIAETQYKVSKLNRNKPLHFETYASLPTSIRDDIKKQIEQSRSEWESAGEPAIYNPDEALIHTGLVSIEAAIRQYVQKYAKTAKIKNIVDTFKTNLEELDCFEKTKKELAENQEESKRIVRVIDSIRKKIDDAKDAKEFKNNVDKTVVETIEASQGAAEGIVAKFQSRITNKIDEYRGEELSVNEADAEVERLIKFAKRLEPDFEVELEELIHNSLIKTNNALLEKYKNKLVSLTDEINIKELTGINIDPFMLMKGSVSSDSLSMRNYIIEKEVEDGQEYVKNTDKKWYKIWTWFQESGYYRTTYKTVKYVDAHALADDFFKDVVRQIEDNANSAYEYAVKQSKNISVWFNGENKRLDQILKSKLNELESYATDKKKAEERIKESQRKLNWLEQIKTKVETILEI